MEIDKEPIKRGLAIEPKGAYVADLRDRRGNPIFLSKQIVIIDGNPKLRGGCHPCWPNFGPGGESGLSQHGVARTSEWKLKAEGDTDVLTLDGSVAPGYEGVHVDVAYAYDDNSFVSTMATYNDSDHEVRVAPAFHPYFDAPAGAEITLDGAPINLAEYHEARSIEGAEHSLTINGRELKLTSEGCSEWIVWSDESAGFVCVEPTRAGASFARSVNPSAIEVIAPGESQVISYTVTWGE
ncbi:hypothetical protein EOL96_04240 [Candidatus Saccharibacteria bacterium]|nr:hypothetical protein [Candidatus Saccharibacteria bacterium]